MKAMIRMSRITNPPDIGNLQVTDPEAKEKPNAIQSANDSPIPQ
jgi:hypothetical protein